VQLGLLPGAGGCQRLPRTIGLRAALDIILAGKSERASKAFRLGMVDELVPKSILLDTALKAADQMVGASVPARPPKGGMMGAIFDRTMPGRRFVYWKARKDTLAKTGGHYPAPLAALEAVRAGLEQGGAAGYAVEHRLFGELAQTDVSRADRDLLRHSEDDGLPPGWPPRAIERLGVIGSGFMGEVAGTTVSSGVTSGWTPNSAGWQGLRHRHPAASSDADHAPS
jgi:3-hydroxyacyl-CoA dehydrogenase/enoyl-CoA hydratase/3-hydroxybutyryl-CoA epimerase